MEFNNVDIERLSGYSYISKYIYMDETLTLKAKGLLSLLFTLPKTWNYTASGLAAINRDGVDAIRKIIGELEDSGYLEVKRGRDENGQLAGNDYKFYQIPLGVDEETVRQKLSKLKNVSESSNIRIEDVPVSLMSNYHLRRKELSLKAKGLLSLMFSLPPTWVFTEKGLAELSADKISTVRSAVKELKEKKYLKIDQYRNEKGRMGQSIYCFYRIPYDMDRAELLKRTSSITPDLEIPYTEKPHTDIPTAAEPTVEKPVEENSVVEKPTVENDGLLNNNSIKNNKNKNLANKDLHNKHLPQQQISKVEKEPVPTLVPSVEETMMMVKEKACYDEIIFFNKKIEQRYLNYEVSDEIYDKYHINVDILEKVIKVLTDVYRSSDEHISLGRENWVSKYLVIDNFENMCGSDIVDIVKTVQYNRPQHVKSYILRVIENY